MTFALVTGTVTAALIGLTAWWWRRAPTRARCPRCGSGTSAVRAQALAEAEERLVRRRWCSGCGWEGLGRNGPEWTPGHPSAHASGFHWGDERFPRDFGFHWAGDETPDTPDAPTPPPDHPSGFRFSREGGAETDQEGVGAFRWGSADAPASVDEEPGTGTRFRWGGSGPTHGAGRPGAFRWKDG